MPRRFGYLDLRPDERAAALLMGTIYFLLLLAYYFLKPARDTLFLVNVSPQKLPLVFILVALVASPVTSLQARLGRRWTLGRLISITMLALAASLIGMHQLVGCRQVWVYYLVYAWVGIVGALTTSQFWLLANAVFDAVQAKRIFSMLAAGGILGAMCGGEITRFLVTRPGIEVEDLLPLAAALLIIVLGLVVIVQRRYCPPSESRAADPDRGASGQGIPAQARSIRRSPHLSLTVGLLATGVVVTTLADYQFKSIAYASMPDDVSLAAFLGRFYGLTSFFSLGVQILLANRLIRWTGVGGVLLVLPVVLTLGAGAFIIVPGLLTATILRGGDLSLRHSLDRTGRELLFLPVPAALKQRTKIFIDLLVDRWFRGLAGVLLLILTAAPGMTVRLLTLPLLLLLAVWIVLALRMRREYVNSFRLALERREVDLDDLKRGISDTQTAGAILEAIRGGNERQILYALELAGALQNDDLVPLLGELLGHGSPDIRRRVLKVLRQCRDVSLEAEVKACLKDAAMDVRRAAIEYLAEIGDRTPEARFTECLEDAEPRVRSAALAWMADHEPELANRLVSESLMRHALADQGPEGGELRRSAVRMLGVWTHSSAGAMLSRMIDDPDPGVAGEALQSVGRRGESGAVPLLLERLSDRRLRVAARRALALLGERSVPALAAVALSNEKDPVWRRQVVTALGEIGTQAGVDHLMDLIRKGTPMIRHAAIASLLKLRQTRSGLDFRSRRARKLQHAALETWYGARLCAAALGREPADSPTRLLIRTLDEKMEYRLLEFIGLLSLHNPIKDMRNAWMGLNSPQKRQRANAIEYLDQILSGSIRDAMRPIALRRSDSVIRAAALDLYGLDLGTPEAVESWLMTRRDPWLRACAAHRYGKGGETLLTVIEKVILLQDVDVFEHVPSEELSALALIALEKSCLRDDLIYRQGEEADALYLVLDGAVRLHRDDHEIVVARRGQAFGTWALLDDEPRLTSATAIEDTSLLRIDRMDFNDLLADNVQIARGIIRAISRRMRALAEGRPNAGGSGK